MDEKTFRDEPSTRSEPFDARLALLGWQLTAPVERGEKLRCGMFRAGAHGAWKGTRSLIANMLTQETDPLSVCSFAR